MITQQSKSLFAAFLMLAGLGLANSAGAADSCQTDFSPERVAAGEACPSQAGDFCPLGRAGGVFDPNTAALPCDGVSIQRFNFTASNGLSSQYLVLRGTAAPQAVYLALHYLNAKNDSHFKVTRLQELAKARNVLIVVPQSPQSAGTLPSVSTDGGSSWPTGSLESVAPHAVFLDEVVADARMRFAVPSLPLYVSGLSNGGSMVYNYACLAQAPIEAIMSVAGAMDLSVQQACQLSRPIGTVIVHGTYDPLNPYNGVPLLSASVPDLHTYFESFDGCVGADRQVTMPTSNLLGATLNYSAVCNTGRRHYLVSIDKGLHYWPGQVSTSLVVSGLLDPKNYPFDATIQGYDLLRQAAGH